MTHPGVPDDIRGTYAAVGHPVIIEHLTNLGVTAVELLPVHQFVNDSHLVDQGLSNYWGYNTIGFLAPHNGYSSSGSDGQQTTEFKAMVKALHEANIEVILDVVYNHTAEGNEKGPTIAFRGIDNANYYRLVDVGQEPLLRHHRHRQQPADAQPARAAADHGLAALLGARDARRRVPLRPGRDAGPAVPRGRQAVGLLRHHPAGPGDQPGQADRRALGPRRRRLPGRQLPAAVDRVERQVPRHRARLLARRAGLVGRVRLADHRVERSLRALRPPPDRVDQLRHRPRRLHPARPGVVQREAQRRQRRGRQRRREPQPLVELRGRGRDRRSRRSTRSGSGSSATSSRR